MVSMKNLNVNLIRLAYETNENFIFNQKIQRGGFTCWIFFCCWFMNKMFTSIFFKPRG